MNSKGKRQRYKVNDDGAFELKEGTFIANPNNSENVVFTNVEHTKLID